MIKISDGFLKKGAFFKLGWAMYKGYTPKREAAAEAGTAAFASMQRDVCRQITPI